MLVYVLLLFTSNFGQGLLRKSYSLLLVFLKKNTLFKKNLKMICLGQITTQGFTLIEIAKTDID